MSTLEEREDYLKNPFFKRSEIGDFTPFYITITICTVLAAVLFLINIALGCCSRYSEYWNDRHTGNRWIIPLWTSTAHKQPPLDLTEINEEYIPPPIKQHEFQPVHYSDIQKRESDL